MDQRQLKEALQPFYNRLKQTCNFIDKLCITETYPGLELALYDVKIIAPNIPANEYDDTVDKIYEILWEETPETIRKSIFNMSLDTEEIELHYKQIEEFALV